MPSDDTSVAILEKHSDQSDRREKSLATLHFHERITADNTENRGINPLKALSSHAQSLALLVNRSLHSLPAASLDLASPQEQQLILRDGSLKRVPDFVTATRGPGMRSNLSCGLDTAKGLSVAWQRPLLAVHHMQAHTLTPRLVHALTPQSHPSSMDPEFPFLSLLVSGGHTLLLHSTSLTEHQTLATTADIAIGEALDKIGRLVLPESIGSSIKDVAYAKHLSEYAFPTPSSYSEYYTPPLTRGAECFPSPTIYGWEIPTPFAETRQLRFSFSGIASSVHRLFAARAALPSFSDAERLSFARSALTVSFNHLASRTVIALQQLRREQQHPIKTLVVSGGVAANAYLRHVLRRFLDVRGFEEVELRFPPVELCTDNAAMVGWCGIEMFEEGWRSELSCRVVRRWSMDSSEGSDGAEVVEVEGRRGILGLEGWYNVKEGVRA